MSRKNRKRRELLRELQYLKVTSFFLIFTITILCTSIFLISKNLKKDTQVKGVNIQTVNSTVNTGSQSKYYSNTLGIEFTYDNNIFLISEENKYISLSTISTALPFKSATIRKIKGKEITDIYQNLNYIETVQDNGVGRILFSYAIPSIINKENTKTEYLTVMYKNFPNDVKIYIQIWGYNFKDDLQTTNTLAKLMESLALSSQELKEDSVLSASSSTISHAQILGQASTVRIYTQKCNNVKFSDSLNYLSVKGKTYMLCSASLGSGFLITDSGYIVTNAHITDSNDFDILLNGHSTDGSYENDMIGDLLILLLPVINNNTEQITEDEVANLTYSLLLEMYNKDYISISHFSSEIYIQADSAFEIDYETGNLINKENYIKAELIKSNKISSTYESRISEDRNLADIADLAVIQTASPLNLPSIPIVKDISVGEKIFAIGYPALADNSELVSSTQILSSTVTEGSVSAIKPNSKNTFDLIQIDAAVENGNSGGPIVNTDGQAIGIVTYKIASDSGNYNFGISGNEILSFLNLSSIQSQSNSMRKSLENSLSDMSIQHYKRAKENLENMLVLQPALITTLQPLITLCNEQISIGEDRSSIIDLNNQTFKILILIILVVLLMVTIVLLLINLKKIADTQKQLPQSKLNTKNL